MKYNKHTLWNGGGGGRKEEGEQVSINYLQHNGIPNTLAGVGWVLLDGEQLQFQ